MIWNENDSRLNPELDHGPLTFQTSVNRYKKRNQANENLLLENNISHFCPICWDKGCSTIVTNLKLLKNSNRSTWQIYD